jgi:hypothetical protein
MAQQKAPPPPPPAMPQDEEVPLVHTGATSGHVERNDYTDSLIPPPVKVTRTPIPAATIDDRKVTIGRTVHVTDPESRKVHPAIVTHVNDEPQSIVATVFKPNETCVGVGFLRSSTGVLSEPGCWHWPI